MSDKGTFSERAEEVLGDGIEATRITLHRSVDGSVIVSVAIATEKHGIIRQHREVPVEKFTPHRLLSAAEDAHGTLTTSLAIIGAGTPDFDDDGE